MATAVKIAEGVAGFSGPATLYEIDPPLGGTDHLLVYYRPRIYGQEGQVTVLLATPGGASFTSDVRPIAGSYVTASPDHALALQIAGGYEIVEEAP